MNHENDHMDDATFQRLLESVNEMKEIMNGEKEPDPEFVWKDGELVESSLIDDV